MEQTYALFLQALRASLRNEPLQARIVPQQLEALLELAQEHHVLPMIYETLHTHPVAAQADSALIERVRRLTIHAVMGQAVKTVDFLKLAEHLRRSGIRLLVVKGIVCRHLYPKPDHRCSGDEDVLCGEAQFQKCHEAMLSFGMEPADPSLESYEVPYTKSDSPLYIELHKTLFSENSDVFSDYNQFFSNAFERSVDVQIRGMSVATLCPTDHMLYLIIHAYKHFLHSGFGIRQVCDIALFANAYGADVDWDYLHRCCQSIRAEKFAKALFQIGEKYLVFSTEQAHLSAIWLDMIVDEEPLLEDMLLGGIYGSTDRSRVHSSNMTINAVAAQKKGQKSGRNVLRTVFPSAQRLEGQYRYLHRHKYLLPVAWTSRLFRFARESLTSRGAPAEVIRTGSRRVELLRQYDIIDR